MDTKKHVLHLSLFFLMIGIAPVQAQDFEWNQGDRQTDRPIQDAHNVYLNSKNLYRGDISPLSIIAQTGFRPLEEGPDPSGGGNSGYVPTPRHSSVAEQDAMQNAQLSDYGKGAVYWLKDSEGKGRLYSPPWAEVIGQYKNFDVQANRKPAHQHSIPPSNIYWQIAKVFLENASDSYKNRDHLPVGFCSGFSHVDQRSPYCQSRFRSSNPGGFCNSSPYCHSSSPNRKDF